jgi:hypothetical protein
MGKDNVEMFSESSENHGGDAGPEPESTEAITGGKHSASRDGTIRDMRSGSAKQPVAKSAGAVPEGLLQEPPAGEESAEVFREGTARDWRDAGTGKAIGDAGDPASAPGQSTEPGTGEAKSRETETFRDGTARDWREGNAADERESSTSKEPRWR